MAKAKKPKKSKGSKSASNIDKNAELEKLDFNLDFLDAKLYKGTGKSKAWLSERFWKVYQDEKELRVNLYKKALEDVKFAKTFVERVVRVFGTRLRKVLSGFTKPGIIEILGVGDPVNYVKFWKETQVKKYLKYKENNKQRTAIFIKDKNEPNNSDPKLVKQGFMCKNAEGKIVPCDIREVFGTGNKNEDGYGKPYPESSNISNLLIYFESHDKEVKGNLYPVTLGGEADDSLANPKSDDYVLDHLRKNAYKPFEAEIGIIRDENDKVVKLLWANGTELRNVPKKYEKKAQKVAEMFKLGNSFKAFNPQSPEMGQHLVKGKNLIKAWKFVQKIENKQDRRSYFWIIKGEVMNIQKRRNDKQGRWTITINDPSMGFVDKDGKPIRGIDLTASAALYAAQIEKVFGNFSEVLAFGTLNRFKYKDRQTKEERWSRVSIDLLGIYAPEEFRVAPPPIPEEEIKPEKPKKIDADMEFEDEGFEETESEELDEIEEEEEEIEETEAEDEISEKEIDDTLNELIEDTDSEDEDEEWDT